MPASSPYIGLMPYLEEDEPYFFGRQAETEIITANLLASRITLLYGPSGVGKSSVIHAGVLPHLRRTVMQEKTMEGAPQFVVVTFSAWRDDPASALAAAIATQFPATQPGSSARLRDKVRACTDSNGSDLLVILDQFEEYFLYHPRERDENSFAHQFASLVNQLDLRVSFLVSLREDSLAKLDSFKGLITNLLDNRLRLDHLDFKAAENAIRGPLARYNELHPDSPAMSIEDQLVSDVLDQVKTGNVVLGDVGQGSVPVEDARIETPYLQLVMTRLWTEETQARSTVLRAATFKALGGAQSIVRSHLDSAIACLSAEEHALAAKVFTQLVTPSRTKIAQTAADLAGYAEVTEPQVQSLLGKLSSGENRILTPVAPAPDHPDTPRYQIFHDVLAASILDWRNRYRAGELAREARLEAQRSAFLRKLVYALAVLLVFAIGAVAWAVFENVQSEKNENEAEIQKHNAEAAEAKAQAAQDLADSRFLELQAAKAAHDGDNATALSLTKQSDAALASYHAANERAEVGKLRADLSKASAGNNAEASSSLLKQSQAAATVAEKTYLEAKRMALAAVQSAPKQQSLSYPAGIDVSKFQGAIDWKAVAASGMTFAFIKASQGSRLDPSFLSNWQGAKAAHLRRGAYHVLDPNLPSADQAAFFIGQLGTLDPDDLPPVLAVQLSDMKVITDWLETVEARIHRQPIVFSRTEQLAEMAQSLAKYRLWIASYTDKSDPGVPWKFWQYTDKGQIPGIRGLVDLNYFHGSAADLQNLR